MKKTIILTIILFMTMTTVVGCGTKEPIHTNDLLYRETKEELGGASTSSICVSLRFAQ
jgi:uncharacterized protein YcfL